MIAGALAIVIGSAAVGLAVNHVSAHGIALFAAAPAAAKGEATPAPEKQTAPSPGATTPLPKGIEPIAVPDARAALDKHLALFIDARPAEQYAAGHIPGAISLPAQDFDKVFPAVADKIEASPFLVVYCEGEECSDSIHVAERLVEFGFLGTRVMVDGFRIWANAGNPVAKGAEP